VRDAACPLSTRGGGRGVDRRSVSTAGAGALVGVGAGRGARPGGAWEDQVVGAMYHIREGGRVDSLELLAGPLILAALHLLPLEANASSRLHLVTCSGLVCRTHTSVLDPVTSFVSCLSRRISHTRHAFPRTSSQCRLRMFLFQRQPPGACQRHHLYSSSFPLSCLVISRQRKCHSRPWASIGFLSWW
jgi:hypothetical protein